MSLSPHELEVNGQGLWDLLKKGAKWLKDNNLVRPLLKAGVKNVLPVVAGIAGGPAASAAVSSVAEKYGDQAVDKAGDLLGFGVGGKQKGKGVKRAPRAPRAPKTPKEPRVPKVAPSLDNMSNFIIPSAPASNPIAPSVPDQSMARVFPRSMSETGLMMQGGAMRGKSFKLAGSSFK